MDTRRQKPGEELPVRKPPSTTRMPEGSVFYEKVVPVVLASLGVLTVTLILFTLSVLFGVIHLP